MAKKGRPKADKGFVTDRTISAGMLNQVPVPRPEVPPVVKTSDPTPKTIFQGHGRYILPLKNRRVTVKFLEERNLLFSTSDKEVIEYLRRDEMKAKGITEIERRPDSGTVIE